LELLSICYTLNRGDYRISNDMEQLRGIRFFKMLALNGNCYAIEKLTTWHLEGEKVGIKVPLNIEKFKSFLEELASMGNVSAEDALVLLERDHPLSITYVRE
jgi:ribosomal protein L5